MLPTPLLRLLTTPSRKFAVLVVLGMCMVALPMAEAWRRLGLEVQAVSAARSGLTPLELNTHTRHALAAHRPYAAAVLSGRLEQEAERAYRQREVDTRLAALSGALETQRLHLALDESGLLRGEWSALLQGLGQRRLRPAASDLSHQLLIEQTYVIADLVSAATGLQAQAGRAFGAAEGTLALVALPRYAAALADLVAAPHDAALPQDVAAARWVVLRRAAHRVARASEEVLARAGVSSPEDAATTAGPAPAVATDENLSLEVLAALSSLREGATLLTHGGAMDAAHAQAAERAALHAGAVLIRHLDSRLAQAEDMHRSDRALLAAAGWLALLVAALAAALSLPRAASEDEPPPRVPAANTDAQDTAPLHTAIGAPGAESEQPTSELLQRLRRSEATADVDTDIEVDIDLTAGRTAERDWPATR